ncbi:MAG: endolytic transglycosylase MltG, partial [Acidimicrobiia bacterium]|nr:endolytic transglycosylase MltG [Acidimicrobiia bacterium]
MHPNEPTPSVWRTLRPLFAIAGIVLAGVAVVTVAANLGERVGASLACDETVSTIEPGLPVTVEIPSGASGERIGEILQENGVIASAAE